MAKYKDWRKFDPLTMRNEQIRNTPEAARSGYSALAPVETVSASVPKLAAANPYDEDFNAGATYGTIGATPDWAKRTPTEQARVNAAQARAQAGATTQGYATLAPATKPVSPYAVPESPYNYGAPKVETATKPASVPTTGTAPSFANLDDASKARMKQNNPALYNQLLVQGIISPLPEDKKTATAPATVPKTDAGSPSTGDTELTGYAKYLADHPEYADSDRRAEAEYARALPTYGALAERMAQAGIHGGYSDYLQGVAYAQMQEQKAALRNEAYEKYANEDGASKKLYNLLRNGTYTDEDGNTVQGYDLLNMTDEQYNANKATYEADLKGQGYTDEQINRAFSDIEATRAQNRAAETKRITDAFTKFKGGETTATEYLKELGVTDEQITAAAQNYAEQYKAESGEEISAEDAQSAVVGAEIIETVDNARKQGLLGEGDAGLKVESDFIRKRLPMYGDEYTATGWKDRGYTLADSIEDALKYKEAGMMTEADVKGVINDALDKMFGNKAKEVKYVKTGKSVKITLDNDEVLKADYAGKASESASAYLNEKYPNCPIAVYEGKLYYKAYDNGNWMELKTKGGITPGFNRGTPEQGDQYFYVVAYAMMQKNDYPAFKDEDTTYDIVNGTATTKAKETTKKATQTKGYNALDYNGGAVGVK